MVTLPTPFPEGVNSHSTLLVGGAAKQIVHASDRQLDVDADDSIGERAVINYRASRSTSESSLTTFPRMRTESPASQALSVFRQARCRGS